MSRINGFRAALCAVAMAAVGASLATAGGGTEFETLEPGKTRVLEVEIPINIVFVGYEQGSGDREINETEFKKHLPPGYEPIVRLPWYYGIQQAMPIKYTFKYNIVYADTTFENAFFSYLDGIAVDADVTALQDYYNAQSAASLTIEDNQCIDAPKTEHWLAKYAPLLIDDVDTEEYTVFYINWYDRADFRHHVYCKTGEPDPDTGHDFGEDDVHKLIAWGGTAPDDEESGSGQLARVWFYDLSAGPEYWTFNCDLDNGDITGDGVDDYRMPPVWEYGNTGYRAFDNLSGDLGMVTRYVAINLLFTPSPLYDPALSAPKLPENIEIDLNVYQFDPDADGNDYIDIPYFLDELTELRPYINFTADSQDVAPTNRNLDIYNCAMTTFGPPEEWESCYGKRLGVPLADLFLYHSDKLLQFVDGDVDYEVPTFVYNLTDDFFLPFLGLADDNWADGTQSFVYCVDSPFIRFIGYGLTATIIHEVGHHIAAPHPHDGHDPEQDIDYGNDGPFFFVGSGDQCNSMMSYIDLNWDFSQFDRDNMDRYMAATYLNMANAILAKVCASPRASKVSAMLASADADATDAVDAFGDAEWLESVLAAKSAYDTILAAAAKINVKIEPEAKSADLKSNGRSAHFITPIMTRRAIR